MGFPHGGLQERTASALGYLARYGPEFLETAARSLDTPGAHVLLSMTATAAGAGMSRAQEPAPPAKPEGAPAEKTR